MASELLIYGLVDPRTDEIRYIGKSARGLRRPRVHTLASVVAKEKTYKGHWIAQLLALGLQPGVVVLEDVGTRDQLATAEIRWIAYGRAAGWPLTNLTSGGEGALGLPMSEATRAKLGAANRRHPALIAANLGKRLSSETRARMSTAKMGHRTSPETKAKIRAALLGRRLAPEARAKLRSFARSRSRSGDGTFTRR